MSTLLKMLWTFVEQYPVNNKRSHLQGNSKAKQENKSSNIGCKNMRSFCLCEMSGWSTFPPDRSRRQAKRFALGGCFCNLMENQNWNRDNNGYSKSMNGCHDMSCAFVFNLINGNDYGCTVSNRSAAYRSKDHSCTSDTQPESKSKTCGSGTQPMPRSKDYTSGTQPKSTDCDVQIDGQTTKQPAPTDNKSEGDKSDHKIQDNVDVELFSRYSQTTAICSLLHEHEGTARQDSDHSDVPQLQVGAMVGGGVIRW